MLQEAARMSQSQIKSNGARQCDPSPFRLQPVHGHLAVFPSHLSRNGGAQADMCGTVRRTPGLSFRSLCALSLEIARSRRLLFLLRQGQEVRGQGVNTNRIS